MQKPVYINNNNWYRIPEDPDIHLHTLITTKNFYNDSSDLTLQFTHDSINNTIMVYRNYKPIQYFFNVQADFGIGAIDHYPIEIADFNGDGLKDIKVLIPNNGCGLASYYYYVAFLIQNKDGTFTQYFFRNIGAGCERDFAHDGKLEFISEEYSRLNGHAYWNFNIYKITNDSLENISLKYNYPMLVPFNNLETFTRTKVPFNKSDYLESPNRFIIDHGTKVH